MRRCICVISFLLIVSLLLPVNNTECGTINPVYTNTDILRDIAIDDDTIWCATSGGVVQYNKSSNESVIYTVADGLEQNDIAAIAVDGTGTVWAGQGKHLSYFDGSGWNFYMNIFDTIRTLFVDSKNRLWVGFDSGLYMIENGSRTNLSDKVVYRPVWSIAEGDNGAMWFGTADTNVYRFKDGEWTHYGQESGIRKFSSDDTVWTIVKDAFGDIWLHTDNAIHRFDGTGFEYHPIIESSETVSVYVMPPFIGLDGTVWALVYKNSTPGLWHFDGEWKEKDIDNAVLDKFSNTEFSWAHTDDDGTVWFFKNITWAGKEYQDRYGLWSFDGEQIRSKRFNTFPVSEVYSIACDNDNTVWMSAGQFLLSCRDGVWSEYDNGEEVFVTIHVDRDGNKYFGSAHGVFTLNGTAIEKILDVWWVEALHKDSRGVLWAATDFSGIFALENGEWRNYTPENSALETSRSFRSIAEQSDGSVWFTSDKNLYRWDGHEFHIERPFQDEWDINTKYLVSDGNDKLWCQIDDAYLLTYDNDKWEWFHKGTWDRPIGLEALRPIICDRNGVVWFSTKNGNIRILKNGAYDDPLAEFEFLDDLNILDLCVDFKNDVWIATNSGLYVFEIQPLSVLENEMMVPAKEPVIHVYPNPFNPVTEISFTISDDSNVTLEVFSVNGQKTATIINGFMTAGAHCTFFDASQQASGIYFYRLKTDKHLKTGKMMLVK